ncbi:MAG: UDP-N-acetylmuramate dehydrogenase [Lachnospiraceae bacterium]|nr:UDP-N-acetylmuramate dehydrogenase [Lachnospiraceae bacterium]
METFLEKLKRVISSERIWQNEPMKQHTTFRVGGPADYYVRPSIEEIQSIITLAKRENMPYTIIGNGSNLLVKDGGIRGLVIELGLEAGMVHLKEGNNHMITAEAGVRLSALAKVAANNSLTGLEFAAGIPGTVGGAVFMNAGAYGGEIKDVIVNATVLDEDGIVRCFSKEDLDLSYRHSAISENGGIVLSASFVLQEGNPDEILAKMADFSARRKEKQPLEFPSAGSTFKRPEGYFAGKLIQDAGLAGYRIGDAQVSEKHCGFVINRGNATATEILQLISDVQEKVQKEFGVKLETEVRILGEDA